MTAITLKNIPDALFKEIEKSATQHKRSIHNEIIHRLQQSLTTNPIDPEKLISRIEELNSLEKAPLLTDELIKEAKNEARF